MVRMSYKGVKLGYPHCSCSFNATMDVCFGQNSLLTVPFSILHRDDQFVRHTSCDSFSNHAKTKTTIMTGKDIVLKANR